MTGLKQIEVIPSSGGLLAGGSMALIGLHESGRVYHGILSQHDGKRRITWTQMEEELPKEAPQAYAV